MWRERDEADTLVLERAAADERRRLENDLTDAAWEQGIASTTNKRGSPASERGERSTGDR